MLRISFNNPWIDAMLEQAWIVSQVTGTVAKCIDPELLSDAQALSDYCLHPSEERLNPLEFHGKRRDATPRRAVPGQPERRAPSPRRKDRRSS